MVVAEPGSLLTFACHNNAAIEPTRSLRVPRLLARSFVTPSTATPARGSRRNIAAHYDLGNDFYQPLARCRHDAIRPGCFLPRDQTLEEAQDAKLDRVLDLLELSGGEQCSKSVAAGAAWPSGCCDRRDCHRDWASPFRPSNWPTRRRVSMAEVQAERCDLRLQDYRDVGGTFDRIVSIEMLEAVGEAYWPIYFAKLRDSLRPGGIGGAASHHDRRSSVRDLSAPARLHPEIHLPGRHAADQGDHRMSKPRRPGLRPVAHRLLSVRGYARTSRSGGGGSSTPGRPSGRSASTSASSGCGSTIWPIARPDLRPA